MCPECSPARRCEKPRASIRITVGLRVLYIGMRFDYGDPRRGDCYEYVNFLDTLRQMEHIEVTHFPFDLVLREQGRTAMNRRLLETVDTVKPDVCFFVLFTDEIAHETHRTHLTQR